MKPFNVAVVAVTAAALVVPTSTQSYAVETSSPLNVLITPREFAEAGGSSLFSQGKGDIDVEVWCPPGPVEAGNDSRVCSLRTTSIWEVSDVRANVIPWALHVHEHPTVDAARGSLFFPNERPFEDSLTPFSVQVVSGSPTFLLDSEWARGSVMTVAKTHGRYQVTATCRTRSRVPDWVESARRCANQLVQAQIERIDNPVEPRGAPMGDVYDAVLSPEELQPLDEGVIEVRRSRLCRVIEESSVATSTSPLAIRCTLDWMGVSYSGDSALYVRSLAIQAASSTARARAYRNSWSATMGGDRSTSPQGGGSVTFVREDRYSLNVEVVRSKGSVVASAVCEGFEVGRKAVTNCARKAVNQQLNSLEGQAFVTPG